MIEIHGIQWRDSKDRSSLKVNRICDACPVCHNAIEPIQVYAYVDTKKMSTSKYAQIVYRCPKDGCYNLFIVNYKSKEGRYQFEAEYVSAQPMTLKAQDFAEIIQKLSPSFCKIFNESLAAEQQELLQICGVGYRKALEFLVKDYLIERRPKDTEKIQLKFLGKCIQEDVKNPNIKAVAKRATWLGNDEAHYKKQWKNQDLTDLKRLIKLVIDWVEIEKLTEEVIKEMPEKSL